MNTLWERIKREPVLLSVFVSAALSLAAQFGINITDEKIDGIISVITTLVLLLGGAAVARQQVVPAKDVVSYVDADANLVSGEATL